MYENLFAVEGNPLLDQRKTPKQLWRGLPVSPSWRFHRPST